MKPTNSDDAISTSCQTASWFGWFQPQSLATVFIIIFVFPSPRPLPCINNYGTNNCWFPLARKWPTWKWTWIWIPYGKIAKKCPRYFRRDSRGNPRDLNMCRTGRSAALSRGRKSMPPIRVPMRMSRDYLYDFTLIFRWSTFSSTVNLCNINCVICSDTHSSFGPPIVAQSMSCEGVHDHENGVSKLT